MKIIFSILMMAGFISTANAQVGELPHYFSFDGYLLDASSNPITTPSNVTLQVYNPAGNCLVYEETHTSVTPAADGSFHLKVGMGTRAGGAVDGGMMWTVVFQNTSTVRSPGTNCSGGYTPTVGDARKLRVTVGGVTLTPDYTISSVPFATTAETLQGKTASQFVTTTGNSTVTGNIHMMNYAELRLHGAGSYSTGFRGPASLPADTIYTMPSTAGSNGQCLATDGANNLVWQTVAAPGASITSMNGLTDAVQTFSVNTFGTSPTWSSGGGIHTLNIPFASAGSVTAGLISKVEYDSFNAKMTAPAGTLNSTMRFTGSTWVSTDGITVDGTGLVTLANNPANNMHAATKQYVDAAMATAITDAGGIMNGNLQFSSFGTATNATVAFGSTNTGLYTPVSNQLSVTANGVEKMRVNSTGVGFGVTNPTAAVEVNGGFKVGPSGLGSQVTWIKNFPAITCSGFTLIAAGSTGSCTATLTSAALTDNIALNCQPENSPPTYPMVHSCYLSANNQLTITVLNAGAGSMTPPNYWNVTMTKF